MKILRNIQNKNALSQTDIFVYSYPWKKSKQLLFLSIF